MLLKKIFPTLLIILHTGAAVMCIPSKDWGGIVYYFAGSVLNVAVAYLM